MPLEIYLSSYVFRTCELATPRKIVGKKKFDHVRNNGIRETVSAEYNLLYWKNTLIEKLCDKSEQWTDMKSVPRGVEVGQGKIEQEEKLKYFVSRQNTQCLRKKLLCVGSAK